MSSLNTLCIRALSIFSMLLLLAGCSTLSPYSKLTKLDLMLTASDRLNPDLHGRPSPIVVRLIELKNPVAFETIDFFSLYERPKESLAPDIVASEELELRPGERLDLKLNVDSGSRYVGVLAAYRDLPETKWRYVVQITPNGHTDAQLRLDQAGIHNATNQFGKTGD